MKTQCVGVQNAKDPHRRNQDALAWKSTTSPAGSAFAMLRARDCTHARVICDAPPAPREARLVRARGKADRTMSPASRRALNASMTFSSIFGHWPWAGGRTVQSSFAYARATLVPVSAISSRCRAFFAARAHASEWHNPRIRVAQLDKQLE